MWSVQFVAKDQSIVTFLIFNFYKIISFLMMEFSERKDDNDG